MIDYFSATFPLIIHEDDFELKIIEDVVTMISEFLGFSKDEVSKNEFAQNRFQYQYTIGEDITLRLGGPRLTSGYKSCSIELKGQGCRSFENHNTTKTWEDLFEFFLVRLNSNVTRLDIAVDDYDGKHLTIKQIIDKLDKKLFTTSFKIKEYTLFNSSKGMTLQFGSRTSTQMLVIYEKLKEQLSQGIAVPEKYWTRFEMRFYQDKAYNIVMNVIKKQLNLRQYVFALLYEMLDIKAKSNYNEDNIHKAPTDPKWRRFLQGVEKAKIEKYKVRKSTHETYSKWATPLAALYFLDIFAHKHFEIEATFIELVKVAIQAIDDINSNKIKKINQFLKESGLKSISLLELEEAKIKLDEYVEASELPF